MSSTMRSPVQSIISDFDAGNADLEGRMTEVFEAYAAETERHARFLNTLSLLEHLGSRKIMATQSSRGLDQATLKHLAEETRHAFFFKRQAEKAAKRELTYARDVLAAPSAAPMYFQRLEGTIAKALGAEAHPRAIYLYMSMIVEFRAVWAYRIYQSVLRRIGSKLSLTSLLAEEQGHLNAMAVELGNIDAFSMDLVGGFQSQERKLFERLLASFEGELASLQKAA